VLEAVLGRLPDAADPEGALLALERWASRLATPAVVLPLLLEEPRLLDDLLALGGASEYLGSIIARDPGSYSFLLEPASRRSITEYATLLDAALAPLQRPAARRDALRRLKRREFLRIGWRDLARGAPLAETIEEISDLAEVLIDGATRLAREEIQPRFPSIAAQHAAGRLAFSVLALGKLGARELNYSSDVDLVFVMDAEGGADEPQRRYATRLAETIIAILSEQTSEGRCFRVDIRLQPEGRGGTLVRTFASFAEYYDRWAETWERQALIKVRPVAGDAALGARIMKLTRPVVFRHAQGAALLEDVREMRAAVEQKLAAAGVLDRNVKEGEGTIRDVEFTVQLLQLLFGAEHPDLQVPDTLSLLGRLEHHDLLTGAERAAFQEGYTLFRAVEHRLQLLDDLPVRQLPGDPRSLRALARSLGFDDAPRFLAVYEQRRRSVRELSAAIHARLGIVTGAHGDPLRNALLTADTPEAEHQLERELAARGFPDPRGSAAALARLAAGPPRMRHPSGTRRLFAELGRTVLSTCSTAADPSLALEGLADLADRKLLHRALYQTWQEHPDGLSALAGFAGSAPVAMRTVLRFPEFADLLTDPEELETSPALTELEQDLTGRLEQSGAFEHRLAALRRFKLRAFVRLVGALVITKAPIDRVTAGWSDVAEVVLRHALREAVRRLREAGRWSNLPPEAGADQPDDFAVLALGRFGGRDLHFASDLDLLYVYSPSDARDPRDYERLATTLGEVLSKTVDTGSLWEVDLRLRPEGRQGSSVVSLEAARRYYGEGGRGQAWEFLMLTRARWVAGSRDVAARFLSEMAPRVYRPTLPDGWREEIRHLKRRMELERVSDARRSRHLKLGPGGLSDIEFAVQLLQLTHGGVSPDLRTPFTRQAIALLHAAGQLRTRESIALEEAFRFLTAARQALTLLCTSGDGNAMPCPEEEPRRASALARALGFPGTTELLHAHAQHTRAVREIWEAL
jgi:glutamate-ammonia-ligase adenylyltransferase